jgi:hypothetical protein
MKQQEVYNLYPAPNDVCVTVARVMKQDSQVARMEETTNAYVNLYGNLYEKRKQEKYYVQYFYLMNKNLII